MKLSKRYLTVPIVLVTLTYLFYSSYKAVKDRTLSEFNIQQFTLAKQASRGIESFFIYYQREMVFLTEIKDVADLNDKGKDLLADFYNTHSDQIEAVTIVDSTGILKFTYPYNSTAIGQNISSQEHVRTVIETHKATVSDVFNSVQGFKAIAYHVPIMNGNKYKGSIAILIPLEKLGKRFVESIRTGETGYGSMISEIGIELFNPFENQSGKSINDIYNEAQSVLKLRDLTRTKTEGTLTCDLSTAGNNQKSAVKTLAAFYRVPLGNTFWTILIFTPEEEIYSKLTSFRNRLYLLILLIIIVMSTYFYLSIKASNVLKEEKKRKAAEKNLMESEKRFRVMFELSPAGIILYDEKGTIIEVNTSFCKTLGYSPAEIVGQNIRLFIAPESEMPIFKNINSVLAGRTIIHEAKHIKKDGTFCIVALYETMIALPDGSSGILSVTNDITEKKRSNERMITLSKALESISECVTITDLQNKIIFVNKAFCKLYGYAEDEIIGKNVSILRDNDNIDLSLEMILPDTIHNNWTGELANVKKDGEKFPIELSTSHITDENDNPVALIGIAVDITERKKIQSELIKAKEKAEESDKLKSAFLANMSHELRTPLNAVIGFSGLMLESGPDKDTMAYSDIILKSGQHLLSLVEDLFDISMIESGQIKINSEEADLEEVLTEVRDFMLGERIRENKTSVELSLIPYKRESGAILVTDVRKLKQILLNLLRNALKFTENGSIEFGFSLEKDAEALIANPHRPAEGDSFYQFFVRDTGIGIDKSYHDTIFNIFRQIDDRRNRKFGGMGIGLAIAKKTVELLGGKIWVESEPSKGSVFYFTLPASPDKKNIEIIHEQKIVGMAKDYSGKTILIAEDEKSNYDFLRILFTRMNIRVLWAQDGMEAVKMAETDPSINLVLMDVKMPLLNGFEATKLIKIQRPELPIIAQTAYAMISDKQEADEAGCDAYLSKPIKINQLTEMIEKFL
jgi:PAS domain S-box-containing protein